MFSSVQKSYTSKAVEHFENFQRQSSSTSTYSHSTSLQKSRSEVLSDRGFKPSDVHNPQTRELLTNLTKRVFHTDQNRTKKIDLQKLFTPSTDFEEIKPGKNRKLYASSAFYTPGIHPTVEDQVELARRISHSLSDISNQKSKGQSMYINRKKRSVKWVHDVNGKDISSYEYEGSSKIEDGQEERTEKTEYSQSSDPKKCPLKFVMNPQGHMRDLFERPEYDPSVPIMSPEPIINALNTTKERGAELFAKRRKKSDKWIVDETNSEKILKSSSMKTTKVFESSSSSTQSTVESISKSINEMKPITPIEPKPDTPTYIATSKLTQSPTIIPYNGYSGLAYRPRVPQGWNAPPIKLQIELEDERERVMKMDEDKENAPALPQINMAEQEQLLKDEQEIMDIYEDSNRHIEYIKEMPEEPEPEVEPVQFLTSFPSTLEQLKVDSGITQEQEEEEYQKVSVRDLVSTFESFQHKEKVHLRKDGIFKESSTESEISEVPKLIQLFTGQTSSSSEPSTPAVAAQVATERKMSLPKKLSPEKVSSETQTPTSAIKVPQQEEEKEKLEETISKFECEIQNMFEATDAGIPGKEEEKKVESNGPTLAPLTIKIDAPPPADLPADNTQLLQPKQKRDALGNVSPLPYAQNTQPLPPDLNINIPEPEPPKPDYSYEAFLSNPATEDVDIPQGARPLDLTSLTNYNTAPRGWGLAKDFYRPIHLGKKFDNLVYSDF